MQSREKGLDWVSRARAGALVAVVLAATGCGQVVAIKVAKQDPNPQGYYVCVPSESGTTFVCQSDRAFHQYDAELAAGEPCEYGVANLHVESNWRGKVTRIQFSCATPPVGEFPKE